MGNKVILTLGDNFSGSVLRGKRVFFARGWDRDNPHLGAWFYLDPTPYRQKNDMIGRYMWDILTGYAIASGLEEPGKFHPEKDTIPERVARPKVAKEPKEPKVSKEKKSKEKPGTFNPFAPKGEA